MKIALFAAVPEEVGSWADHVNFTGIGRENATRTALAFMQRHAGEKITVVNFGTVGAHHLPVGTVLTLAATGSESSNSSVITNEATHEKVGLGHQFNRPNHSPTPTKTLSQHEPETAQ